MTAPDLPSVEGVEIYEEIGRGGFGVVYRGREQALSRDVAVKVLTTRLDADGRARFDRECTALGSLSGHPHIVRVYRSGTTAAGQAYLVMELERDSLARRVDGRPADWGTAVGWGVQLAGALETAHRAGVLHRDIKPENVLFSAYDEPVLVDFGIAAVRGGFETRSSRITASLAHAAPEVLNGVRASPSSDVYSLASTLYVALAGRAAFVSDADETLAPLIARVATARPPDLRPLGVPSGVAEVVERGLEKDPGGRPLTALAFAEALAQAAAAAGRTVRPAVVPSTPSSAAAATSAAAGAPAPDNETRPAPLRRPDPTPTPPPQPRAWRPLLAGTAGAGALAAGVAFLLLGPYPFGGEDVAPSPSPSLPSPSPSPTSLGVPVLMPDVAGLPREKAEQAVRAELAVLAVRSSSDVEAYQKAHLAYQVAYQDGHWPASQVAIWSQFPGPGERIEIGQVVTVVQWDKAYCDQHPEEYDLRGNWCYEQPPTRPVLTGYYDRRTNSGVSP